MRQRREGPGHWIASKGKDSVDHEGSSSKWKTLRPRRLGDSDVRDQAIRSLARAKIQLIMRVAAFEFFLSMTETSCA